MIAVYLRIWHEFDAVRVSVKKCPSRMDIPDIEVRAVSHVLRVISNGRVAAAAEDCLMSLDLAAATGGAQVAAVSHDSTGLETGQRQVAFRQHSF